MQGCRPMERRSSRLVGVGRRFRGVGVPGVLPPLLEEAHALAAAVGPPEVAPARGRVAAVPGAVVAVAATPHTGAPENVDQRRTSETTSLNASLSLCRAICKAHEVKSHKIIFILA